VFKFIILSIIGFYILFKVVGFLFRLLISASANNLRSYQQSQQYQQQQANSSNHKKAAPNSNVNIDYIPDDRSKTEFKGGDYVDYEEVK
jgi:hypothetical protein